VPASLYSIPSEVIESCLIPHLGSHTSQLFNTVSKELHRTLQTTTNFYSDRRIAVIDSASDDSLLSRMLRKGSVTDITVDVSEPYRRIGNMTVLLTECSVDFPAYAAGSSNIKIIRYRSPNTVVFKCSTFSNISSYKHLQHLELELGYRNMEEGDWVDLFRQLPSTLKVFKATSGRYLPRIREGLLAADQLALSSLELSNCIAGVSDPPTAIEPFTLTGSIDSLTSIRLECTTTNLQEMVSSCIPYSKLNKLSIMFEGSLSHELFAERDLAIEISKLKSLTSLDLIDATADELALIFAHQPEMDDQPLKNCIHLSVPAQSIEAWCKVSPRLRHLQSITLAGSGSVIGYKAMLDLAANLKGWGIKIRCKIIAQCFVDLAGITPVESTLFIRKVLRRLHATSRGYGIVEGLVKIKSLDGVGAGATVMKACKQLYPSDIISLMMLAGNLDNLERLYVNYSYGSICGTDTGLPEKYAKLSEVVLMVNYRITTPAVCGVFIGTFVRAFGGRVKVSVFPRPGCDLASVRSMVAEAHKDLRGTLWQDNVVLTKGV
jgi:hypothetical protein